MKKIIALFLDFLSYFHIKKILILTERTKDKFINLSLYFLMLTFIFNLFNYILIAPCFFYSVNVENLLYPLFFNFIFLPLLGALFYRSLRNVEKLNNDLMKKSIQKSDFYNFLSNDVFFNINFSLVLSLGLILYSIFFYFPLFFIVKLSIFKILIILIIICLFLTIFVFAFNFATYLLNRKIDKTFFEFYNYKGKYSGKIAPALIFFLIVFIFSSFTINLFYKNLFVVLGAGLIISAAITAFTLFFLEKIHFFSKNRIAYLSKKFNKFFFNEPSKIEVYNVLNFIKSLKFIYILAIFFVYFFTSLFVINKLFKLDYKIILFQSLLFPMFFSKALLVKDNVETKKTDRSFIFTSSLFGVIFVATFFKSFDFSFLFENAFFALLKDFINPFFDVYNEVSSAKETFFKDIFVLFIFLTPIVFCTTFWGARFFYHFKSNIEYFFDGRLKNKLNCESSTLLFGDSASQYYFLFSLVSSILALFALNTLLKPMSEMIFGLFDAFQVQTIFKLNFLSKDNIFNFFRLLLTLFRVYIVIKLIHSFLSNLLTHFMLFSNEVVYYENKIYKTSVLRLPVSKIKYIIIKQNFIEKFFDIGSVYIETGDKNGLIKISGISSIESKN
ncbi:MAG TPA: hypothetical protein PLO89_04425, partial [Spirochaetota bacterium]|nr:hypothetical protein [Spirochaetota bacterium]